MLTHLDIPLAEYHADTEHASNSRLRSFRERGAAYYNARYIARTLPDTKPTAAMVLGSAFEDLVQRPDEWPSLYAVKPDDHDGRTVDGKAWTKANAARAQVSADDGARLQRMADRAWDLLACGEGPQGTMLVQPSFRATVEGVKCQARPDWIVGDAVLDLKSTDSINDVDRSIATYGYHTQCMLAHACMHGDIEAAGRPSWLLFVEKQEPHRGVLVELDLSWLAIASATLGRDLALLRQCQASGEWPLVWSKTIVSSAPPWVTV